MRNFFITLFSKIKPNLAFIKKGIYEYTHAEQIKEMPCLKLNKPEKKTKRICTAPYLCEYAEADLMSDKILCKYDIDCGHLVEVTRSEVAENV